MVSVLKSTANRSEFLASKLSERASFRYTTEQNNEKLHRGIAWPQVCATESDVAVSEREEAPLPSMKEEADSSAHVVEELLPVVKSENVFGREQEKDQLLSQLMPPSHSHGGVQFTVIPIMGMSGIGKTTLARLVYNEEKVHKYFELKAWVKMGGQKQKQLCDIARKLLKSATGMLCPLNSLSELDEMVFDALLSQRSLIVLDDVESMDLEQWQHMKNSWFRFLGLGSKIIITTCNKQVADIEASTPFHLRKLSIYAGRSLYSSLAFSPAAPQLADRCEGLPLSLKLLGSLIRFHEEISAADIIEDISSFLDESMVLSISVLALPNALFNCFAYCGIFPCGYVLEKERLIKMWIADGLVKPGIKALEDIGEDYFHQLLCRSFFTDITCNEYGDIVQARMPSIIHKVAQEIAAVVFNEKVGYASRVDENSVRVSVALPFLEVYRPRNLQTMVSLPAKNLSSQVYPNRFFVEFKRLRSLDLSRSGIRYLSKHICTLRKLRYLNLSHTLLTKLPKSFTTLARLQTLDLSGCYFLKALPKKLSSLSQLRHLDLSQCNSLDHTPFGIGRLISLMTMTLYVLGEKELGGAALRELHKLNELRGVLHIRNLENVKKISEAKDADLEKKKLHHLGLSWSHKVDECHTVLEWLQPNPQLRVLDLTGYGAYGFPSWMQNLHNLVKLLINDCRCTKLPTLGKLPSLKELQLKELINIRSIGQEFYGDDDEDEEGHVFPSLEKLKLHDMPNLNHWSDAAQGSNDSSAQLRVFPSLKSVSIQGCPELQSVPLLPYVTELVVWRSHSKILPLLTRVRSLSSIVINDMDVKESFGGLSRLNSVKKLIIVNSMDLDSLESSHINKFTALQHLRILQCLKLQYVHLGSHSLQKLNIVDCQKLNGIDLPTAESFTLKELVIEDCPQLTSIAVATNSHSCLRKLILRNCPKLVTISPQIFRNVEFLFISRCPQMEEFSKDVEKS
ncbi:hypothetical protein C2S51_027042 [Perilla frutescens var. frutescens]|nr:hypothetical protein C2S51_027042 [Perilla frutescens var. frutescens]